MTTTFSISQLAHVASQVLAEAKGCKTILFEGEMGAGKTTLIKAICVELGISAPVSSPTFALVNEYEYPGGLVYHFDAYRLKSPIEALDMGFEEYLASGEYCFIEWPDKVDGLWPAQYLKAALAALDTQTRQITTERVG